MNFVDTEVGYIQLVALQCSSALYVYPIIPKSDSDFQLEAVCGIWLLEICLTFVIKPTIWCQEKLPKECVIFPINVVNHFLIYLCGFFCKDTYK